MKQNHPCVCQYTEDIRSYTSKKQDGLVNCKETGQSWKDKYQGIDPWTIFMEE